MSRPNFFIVGAPKCGTTAWYEYLRSHPDIYLPAAKEPHYFCTDLPGFRWVQSESRYLELFAPAHSARAIGEASVQYLYSAQAAINIAAFDPRAKILIFLRQPAPFLHAYHQQLLRNLDEDVTDFARAWRLCAAPGARTVPRTCREPRLLDYRAAARFSEQVARYLRVFSPAQVMLVEFEQWTRQPRATYLEVLAFLGVADDGRREFPRINAARSLASTRVARFTQRPPDWALALARALRTALGRERLGAARLLQRANSRPAPASAMPAELEAEIEAYFREDQRALATQRALLANTR